ncbi:hypothetical protein [Nocardioides litoris]|uniref:hypothetical protein n=1 Tax=Nocardioides litoris TaxID=1926648 RepID=UPI00111DF1B5|nr:hypothetical protein [Nocardioides litoris]
MLLDVRRGVRLGMPPDRAAVSVPTPPPGPGTAFAARRLHLHGRPVFELALWCGTCPAVFTKASTPERADLGLAAERLAAGLDRVDRRVLRAWGRALPRSSYTVLLLEVAPRLVTPGAAEDYFSHEQVATWGTEPLTGVPEHPGTPYYRTFDTPVPEDELDGHLHELVVPMVPPSWNDPATTASYAGAPPTATAVSYALLDVVVPATSGDATDWHRHWVLQHFLLDGHHKVEAAAAAGRPVRLLALLDESKSLAGPADLDVLLAARRRPPGHRRRPGA